MSTVNTIWALLEHALGKNFQKDSRLKEDIRKLSELLTSGRNDRKFENYFKDEKLKKAYTAYFLPLNFAKVAHIFSDNQNYYTAAIEKERRIRIIDFGCGPGTATLAFLAMFHEKTMPGIEIHLIDNQPQALELARKLVTILSDEYHLEAEIHTGSDLNSLLSDKESFTFSFAVNVLNEIPGGRGPNEKDPLLELCKKTQGLTLFLEPAHRVASQRLIRFRERLRKDKEFQNENFFLAPCLHQETCPLFDTKNWCHFSEPVVDMKLVDWNLEVFKNPRLWLKFSYLLFGKIQPREIKPGTFRAIGDLHPSNGRLAIDLCQPKEKKVHVIPASAPESIKEKLKRGAIVNIK